MEYFLEGLGAGILLMLGLYYWNIGRHRRKQEIPSLTKYVIFSISMVIIYSIASFVYQWQTKNEISGVLTSCYFATFGGEVVFCAIMKIFKIRKQ